MAITTLLDRASLTVLDYRCTAQPHDRPFFAPRACLRADPGDWRATIAA